MKDKDRICLREAKKTSVKEDRLTPELILNQRSVSLKREKERNPSQKIPKHQDKHFSSAKRQTETQIKDEICETVARRS